MFFGWGLRLGRAHALLNLRSWLYYADGWRVGFAYPINFSTTVRF